MNKIKEEVFRLFTATDSIRKVMNNPFETNGKVYATNEHVLIFADKENIDFEINNEHEPLEVDKVIEKPNKNILLTLNKSDFEKYKTKDEYKKDGEDVDCHICDGDGVVEWECGHYTKDDECPECDGDGIIEKSIKTGRKIFCDVYVKLNDIYFDIKYFYKLVEVRDLLEEHIFLIYQDKSKAMFKIGSCQIIIMAININKTEKEFVVLNYSTE